MHNTLQIEPPKRTCSIEGCNRPHFGLGFCMLHYTRVRRGCLDMRPDRLPYGTKGSKWRPNDPRYKNKGRLCDVEGCRQPFYAKGFCQKHYSLYKTYGIPKKIKERKFPSICSVPGCTELVKLRGMCKFHYVRSQRGTTLDRPKGNKGSLNVRWNGGTSQYPNHYELKKNRKIVLRDANYTCEFCGAYTNKVHHRDHKKTNHKISNLAACCHSCNLLLAGKRKKYTSKYMRLYGKTLRELRLELNINCTKIRELHKEGNLYKMLVSPTPTEVEAILF